MSEIIYRRYSRLLRDKQPLPQLVVIDGGKGQLSAAAESIDALGLSDQMTLIGLAKNVEEIFFKNDRESLKLPYQSQSLAMLRRIRDEVHRFGLAFHRNKRSKGAIKNELENIAGIGPKTMELLMKTYRSEKNILEAGRESISGLIGNKKAQALWDHLLKNKKGEG
jgi:excinuclease ABC subunit C